MVHFQWNCADNGMPFAPAALLALFPFGFNWPSLHVARNNGSSVAVLESFYPSLDELAILKFVLARIRRVF
jgi:hypothetical protein